MKPHLREATLIGVALLLLLGCGFGLGKMSSRHQSATLLDQNAVLMGQFEQEFLESMRSTLSLTPDQEEAMNVDVERFTKDVFEIRQKALLHYHESLLQFHDQISPKLFAHQNDILLRNRKRLEKEIELRFPKDRKK